MILLNVILNSLIGIEEFVYNYYIEKINNNYFLNISNLFDNLEL